MSTILTKFKSDLEGYGEIPIWEIMSYKQEDNIFSLVVKRRGELTRSTELDDLVTKLSYYDETFEFLSAIKVCDCWHITVTMKNKTLQEVE